jgi:hypothetical protein
MLTKGKKSAVPTLKDFENNSKVKAELLASHFEGIVKEKIALVKDLQDYNLVKPILDY